MKFNYNFLQDELIILYDQNAQIYSDDSSVECCIMLTNKNLIFFTDVNNEQESNQILRITKGVNNLPNYEPFIIKKISDLEEIILGNDTDQYLFVDMTSILINKNTVTKELLKDK